MRKPIGPAATSVLLLVSMIGACVPGAHAEITGVTAGPVRLTAPPDSTPEQPLSYGLGFPFQVAADRAALFCNVRVEGVATFDYENGTDVIVFDSLEGIGAAPPVIISRNERLTDAGGAPRIVVKFPIIGGFVPLGALRPGGSPHPHAGTGFGLCQAISFPVDEAGLFNWQTERIHRCELHQLSYDGERFAAERVAQLPERPHPWVGESAWRISAPGITNAIPDGDDLLQAVQASDGSGSSSGVVRWSRAGGSWEPVEFSPVTPRNEGWAEASLVRDTDGALLFSARGGVGDQLSEVRVWRYYQGEPQWRLVFSTPDVRVLHREEGGPQWEQVLSAPGAHNPGPISINRAADGTPFIGANLPASGRETLCLWPLNEARAGLLEPLTARAARDEFGAPAAADARWMVDHPSGAVVRLADGAWHALLAYRILDSAEHRGAAPTERTGCYVEEVHSDGPVMAAWRFE